MIVLLCPTLGTTIDLLTTTAMLDRVLTKAKKKLDRVPAKEPDRDPAWTLNRSLRKVVTVKSPKYACVRSRAPLVNVMTVF